MQQGCIHISHSGEATNTSARYGCIMGLAITVPAARLHTHQPYLQQHCLPVHNSHPAAKPPHIKHTCSKVAYTLAGSSGLEANVGVAPRALSAAATPALPKASLRSNRTCFSLKASMRLHGYSSDCHKDEALTTNTPVFSYQSRHKSRVWGLKWTCFLEGFNAPAWVHQ
jgi:hypothetical protein